MTPHLPKNIPHPLALALIDRMRAYPNAAILEIGIGSGRNAAALSQAGLVVHATRDYLDLRPEKVLFRAAISTHALLHGTTEQIRTALQAIAARLVAGAPLCATFGSTRDARFGEGTRIDAYTFAPIDGDERGVTHTFFDEPRLRALLADNYDIESIEERNVDAIAGAWAHTTRPLRAAVHWFVIATRP